MAREEYIRIYRSDVGGATPSLTSGEIATNLVDGKFFIGGTNGSLITFTSNSYNVTSVNGLTGAVVSIATTGSNVFTGLNTFNVGIIAAGATFTGDIALQGVYDEGSQTTNKTTLTVVNPTANRTISLPDASGTVALTNATVTSFNGLTGTVSLTGDGGAVQGKVNNKLTVRVVTDNAMTGVASFDFSHFTVGSTGHVRSKGIITINGSSPDVDGNFQVAAATVVTGDGGAIQGKGGAFITARLVTAAGATGVASFRNTHFLVDGTGHVQLAAAYQVTGDTVQAGTFINIGAGKTINNIGVQTLNGATGAVSLTGAGALFGYGNNTIGIRNGSYTLTGVASFDPLYFGIGTSGHLVLTGSYQVTGDTVQAGSGIAIGTDKTITNIGVTGIGFGNNDIGLTGKINLTAGNGMNLTRSGNTLSYSVKNFAFVDSINIASSNIIGSDLFTITGGTGIYTRMSDSKNTLSIYSQFATTDTTAGIAWFRDEQFLVSSGGRVGLAAAYQVTGDTVQAGTFINIGAGKTINNIGVQTFNGLTGARTLTGDGGAVVGKENNKLTVRVVTDNAMTGVASFDFSHFTVGSTGHVRSKGVITINGQSPTDGNFTIASATVVTGDNGAIQGKGDAFITARLATTEATGVAAFNDAQFSVNEYASVSLIYPYDPTYVAFENTSNIFTSKQYFTAGISAADSIYVGSGVTSIEIAYRPFQGDLSEPPTKYTLIKSNDQGGLYLFSSGGTTASSIVMNTGGLRLGHNGLSGMATVSIGLADDEGGAVPEGGYGSQLKFAASDGNDTTYFALKTPTSSGVENINLTLPNTSGTLALTRSVVTSIGFDVGDVGLTGKVNITAGSNITITKLGNTISIAGEAQQTTAVTGDGAAIIGRDNAFVTARLATAAGATGVASFRNTHFTVGTTGHVQLAAAYQVTGDTVQAGSFINIGAGKTINNIGVQTFNSLTGAVSLTGDGGAVRGHENNKVTVRLTTAAGATGVASFRNTHFLVDGTGHVQLAAAYQVTGDTVQAGTFINIGAGKTINNIGVQTFNGLTGARTLTGDGWAIRGVGNNAITALTGGCGFTGVVGVDCTKFVINGNGIITGLVASQACNPTPTTQQACTDCGGLWQADMGGGGGSCVLGVAPKYSGLGVSAGADGTISFLYFDPGNLTYGSTTTIDPAEDFVLFYDSSETGLVKTKRIRSDKILLDNDGVFNSKTSQLVKSKSASKIEFEIVLGAVAVADQGLVKGASAFSYITQNTVKSINGATGDVMVVGNINGCTGAIVITGTTNEVMVTNSCPNITIGLPDNVSIPYLSGTGATFTQTVTATRFIGIVSGGDF